MAEYVLRHDDDQQEISKMLLEHAGDRAREIEWRPRPDRPHGGVFYVPDDLADGLESDRLNQVDEGPTPEELAAQRAQEQDQQDQQAEQEPRQSRAAARRAAKAEQSKE